MVIVFGIAIVALVVFGPSLWARFVLARHGDERGYFPGTASELARHLLDEAGLQTVMVERTDGGDHYDPKEKAVRLSPANMHSRSLTAVVTATHEVGHAIQDRDGYTPLRTRTHLVRTTRLVTRVGSAILLTTGVLAAATHAPIVALLGLVATILTLGINVAIHLVTLPVEYDASFNRALPILDHGGYVPPADLPAAREILHACALTYVAAALVNLLYFVRWIRAFR